MATLKRIRNCSLSLKSFFLAILLTLFFLPNAFSQDMLDKVISNSKLVTELKDIYRTYKVHLKIADQNETIRILQSEGTEKNLNIQLEKFIKEFASFKNVYFYDNTLHSHLNKYVESTIRSYQVSIKKGSYSEEFKTESEKANEAKKQYFTYLRRTYPTNHFISMKEDDYWKIVDKNNYIRSAKYDAYKKLKTKDLKAALKLLDEISKETMDFLESSVYQIEMADQYEKHADSLGENSSQIAISTYKSIITQNKYCIYLFEAWLKWRTVTQQHAGLSKSSDIPNDTYNELREQAAFTILEYISRDGKDEMAINEFTLIATHDIVRRFGDYPYGNQNTVEYHEIFNNIK